MAIWTVVLAGTVTNAGGDVDLLEIVPADDKPCRLRGFTLGQTSEVGDAAEEGIRISIIRLPATFTSGSGGSAATPQTPDDLNTSTVGFTAEVNNTTIATTSGTAVTLMELAWNERSSPYEFWWPDERFCPTVRQAAGLVVRQQTTIADDMSVAMTFYVEEM